MFLICFFINGMEGDTTRSGDVFSMSSSVDLVSSSSPIFSSSSPPASQRRDSIRGSSVQSPIIIVPEDGEDISMVESIGDRNDGISIVSNPLSSSIDLTDITAPTLLNIDSFKRNKNSINSPKQESTRPIRKQSKTVPEFVDDDEKKTKCPVCLERWSAEGAHRVCTLRCGHLFGLSCIKQWIFSNKNGRKRPGCPICQKSIFQNDIVCLYIGDIYALDSSELDISNERLKTAKKDLQVSIIINKNNIFFLIFIKK